MKNSKKVFLGLAVLFMVAMVLIGIDISRRTTFPGSKPQLKQRLMDDGKPTADSVQRADSMPG